MVKLMTFSLLIISNITLHGMQLGVNGPAGTFAQNLDEITNKEKNEKGFDYPANNQQPQYHTLPKFFIVYNDKKTKNKKPLNSKL